MRTAILFFEQDTVAIACGAPGHIMSAAFAATPQERVLARLSELLGSYEPERVMLSGENSDSAAVEFWLSQRGQSFGRMPEAVIEPMAAALESGETCLEILEQDDAQFDRYGPCEARAVAALELHHRLMNWSAEQLRSGGLYQ